MQLSKYFSLNQLTYSDTANARGINNTPDTFAQGNLQRLAVLLDQIYDQVGPFRITSGYRSPELNAAIQGSHPASNTSLHMRGMAADVYPLSDSVDNFFWKLAASPLKHSTGEIINESEGEGVVHISLPYTDSMGVARTGYLKYLSGGSYYPYSASEIDRRTGGASQDQGSIFEDYAQSVGAGLSIPVIPILLTAAVLGGVLFMVKLNQRSNA